MPDYLAPGVYIEEVGCGPAPIAGVPTSVAGFIGPARFGPVTGHRIVTSLVEYEALFGDGASLAPGGQPALNHLWHAARVYFAQGGQQLAIARIVRPADPADRWSGHARASLAPLAIHARHPGAAGVLQLRLTLALGPTLAATDADIVWNDGTQGFEAFPGGRPPAGLRPVLVALAIQHGASADRYTDLSLDPGHPRALFATFAPVLKSADDRVPIIVTAPDATTGLDVLNGLLARVPTLAAAWRNPASRDDERQIVIDLIGGDDGLTPDLAAYADGLARLEAADDVSTIAAPGSTAGDGALARAVAEALIDHAARLRYRLALVDSLPGQDIGAVRAYRAGFDSKYGAFYYPWVIVADPASRAGATLSLPPSAFVAGLFARVDGQRGVAKAPANEVVTLATGFERAIDKGQQDVLNPEGINCFRIFPGQGNRLYGARTLSSDPEWKYVNVRRYLSYLERSIDRGLQWCVFEPNGPDLWAQARALVQAFLVNEWRAGRLLGTKAEEAFFVRCDRSTMTQADIDGGRLICLVGLAVIKPAEFVIVRIGQLTAAAQG